MADEAPPPDDDQRPKVGRPSKLEPKRAAKLFNALRRGHPPETACDLAGICRATFYNWLDAGKADKEAGRKTEHAEFLDRSNRALALFYDKHLRRIDRASADEVGAVEYRASLQILARRAPQYFAERKGVELSGPNGGAIQVQTLDELIAQAHAGTGGSDPKGA